MKWKLTYQTVPFVRTEPRVIVVDAADRPGAIVAGYVELTERGLAVYTGNLILPRSARFTDTTPILTAAELALAHSAGLPVEGYGGTHIVGLEPHYRLNNHAGNEVTVGFRDRFREQGYYLTADGQRIPPAPGTLATATRHERQCGCAS